MFRRHHAIVAILSLPALAIFTAGCEDDEKATPQAIFDGRLQLGTGNDCKDSGSLFTVGEFGTPAAALKSQPISDGASYDQGTVSVSCTVTPAGTDTFDVAASVLLTGAKGGLFRIDGKFKTTGEQTGIHAIFSNRLSGNTYEQKDRSCIVRYTSQNQGVASGRVWGEVDCPSAENTGAQTACQAIAQFRFENCL